MTTHSSILAWRIPRIEEPGGYSPWGSQSWTRLIEYTWRLRDAWGLSQSHVAGLGTRPGSLLLRCPISPAPLPPAGLQVPIMYLLVHQSGTEELVGIQGGGCAIWPGTGVVGHSGPSAWRWGQVPPLFQRLNSSLTLQTAKHMAFWGPWGLF